ncbi:pesticin receptor [Candidatus Phycosocius bacilliformis]|uniref:Pesticin receptor n=1 Tax=Candidatus Phycosocius bacilliformis TaxID=1445552 RepID=A0A2P2EBV8_9PROT|nr:TonB-dependent receptor [Candidatus Phycosocius bacilliformis]GBF58550.1 pesticin receptor [Candidatus Phycosocius bacilliformis]
MRSITTSRLRRLSLLSTICLAGFGFAGLAQAQTAPAADEPDQATDVVIVTATKRETTLQSIPVAVSVTSADTINKAQVRDLNDLQTLVPSLRVSTNQSSSNATFIIRGFGNGANNAGIEPSVAIFIDGVYRSRAAAGIGDLPNLQRVEVLRGPQSTLFGKNASAGVISVVTREPKFEYGGSAEISYGNFNAIVAKADVTGPLGENAAGSFAFGINKRDGYVDNLAIGKKINDRDRYYVRGDLLIKPNDQLKVRAIVDYDHLEELCCAVVNVKDGPTGAIIRGIGGKIVSNSPFTDQVYSEIAPVNEISNQGVSLQIDYDFGKWQFTSISAYRNSKNFSDGDIDFTSAALASAYNRFSIDTLTQEFRLASSYEGPLNFLLGGYLFKEEIDQQQGVVYQKDFRAYANGLTGGASSPLALIEGALGLPVGTTFQRQGTGTTEDMGMKNDAASLFGTLDYKITPSLTLTTGFNYTDDIKKARINILSTDTFSGLDLNAFGAAFITGQLTPFVGATTAAAIGRSIAGVPCSATVVAPNCNPFLALRGLQFQPPFLNIPNAVESGKTNDSKTTYSVRLAWEINDNWNAYASYATGFKATSFNLSRDSRPFAADFIPGNPILNPAPSRIRNAGLAVTNLSTGTRYAGPEEATVSEIGIKARFPTGAFNLTLFDQQIDGFQSNVFTGTGFQLANAGTQSSKGVEFDATYRPIRPLQLSFAMTYLDPKYDDFKQSAFGDLSGVTPAGIAKLSYTLGATYVQPLANGERLTIRGDFFHEDKTQIADGLEGNRAAAIPYTREVNTLNAGVLYTMNNGWELTLWGRNLTDDRYLTTIFAGVAQAGTVSGYPSQPRTYGVSAKYIW